MIYSYHEPERRDTVFKNKNGELRSGWKIAGMLGTVFGVLFLLMFLIQFGFVFIMTTTGNLDPTTAAATPLAFQTAAIINSSMMFLQTIVMITIPILLWTKVLKKDKASLGLPPLAKQRRTMRQGLAMGAGSMTLVFLLLIVTDSAQVLTWIPQGSPSLLIMFFLYILIGYSEEIICRGYIQGVMRQTHNPGLIILVPSLIFSLLHSANQGIGVASLSQSLSDRLVSVADHTFQRQPVFGHRFSYFLEFLPGTNLRLFCQRRSGKRSADNLYERQFPA